MIVASPMEIQCMICGRPLRAPVSIARGMGPKCAGDTNGIKSFWSSPHVYSRTSYSSIGENHATTNLFSFIDERQDKVPETLSRFPPDLVDLVLSAPAAGSITARIKLHSHRRPKNDAVDLAKLLKQIRRMCIEFRLLFWPGLSLNFYQSKERYLVSCVAQFQRSMLVNTRCSPATLDALVCQENIGK